jgi:hypothetical protein
MNVAVRIGSTASTAGFSRLGQLVMRSGGKTSTSMRRTTVPTNRKRPTISGAVSHEEHRGHRGHEGDVEQREEYHQNRPGGPEDCTHQERDERYLYPQTDDVREEQDDEADDRVDGEGS